MSAAIVNVAYVGAATLFVFALKGLSHPAKAVRGNLQGALGMLIAIVVTLVDRRIVRLDIILAGLVLGSFFGVLLATRIKMTAMPELVALFNGLGGGASVLVAGSALMASTAEAPIVAASAVSGLVGAITFAGSLVAMGKLQGWLGVRPSMALVQRIAVALLAAGAIALAASLLQDPGAYGTLVGVASVLGLLLVLPIGGADMPVVIAFLNSGSGLAAAATGFVLMNQALIISGSLVGASGFILTQIMCRAMNRTLWDVLFGGAPANTGAIEGAGETLPVKSVSADEVAMILDAARRVVIVPGYGMAVAQAQHAVARLSRELHSRGVRVDYAIHPVAGRMPGHMNLLLAEADVPYDELKDLEAINPELVEVDVALVIGANDVVNPSARTDHESPIYGMPILDVDEARTVVVFKRSLRPGFAGVANPLFTADNTVMFFGDAKASVLSLIQAIDEL